MPVISRISCGPTFTSFLFLSLHFCSSCWGLFYLVDWLNYFRLHIWFCGAFKIAIKISLINLIVAKSDLTLFLFHKFIHHFLFPIQLSHVWYVVLLATNMGSIDCDFMEIICESNSVSLHLKGRIPLVFRTRYIVSLQKVFRSHWWLPFQVRQNVLQSHQLHIRLRFKAPA